jgi:hypothetical protein
MQQINTVEVPAVAVGTLITVYLTSEWSNHVKKYEGKYVSHGTRKYAQYNNAPFVRFIPKGKRKFVEVQKCFHAYIVIIKGHGHPDGPEEPKTVEDCGDVVVTTHHYSNFDERHTNDFEKFINEYLPKCEVIADYRHTQGFNPY